MAATSSPADDERTYAHPGLVRGLAISGVAIGVASLSGLLALPYLQPGRYSGLLILCCLVAVAAGLLVAVAIARRSRDTIVVTREGLWCRSPAAPPVFIAWSEVGAVEPQNVMQRLVVTDRTGSRRIHLEYHLERFGELRREVLASAGRAAGGSGVSK